jgi:two-component system chemotaxis sensor kinase CheA
MGKGELSIAIEASDALVDPRRFRGLWSALIHVVRNAIDHGIELPAERLARSKGAEGHLFLRAFESSSELVLEIEDDGRGIDWGRVRQVAARRGLRQQSEADLVRALLNEGLSTRSSVSLTSGRGIGMSAVNHQVAELGGAISVQSQDGVGTCWRISIPLSVGPALAPAIPETPPADSQDNGRPLRVDVR